MNDVSGWLDAFTTEEADPFPRPSAAMILSLVSDVSSHFLEVSSVRIRLRIKGSGTSPPEFIYFSAFCPAPVVSLAHSSLERACRTKRSFVLHIVAKEISCRNRTELWEASDQSLGLRSFPHTWSSHQDYSSSIPQLASSSSKSHDKFVQEEKQ